MITSNHLYQKKKFHGDYNFNSLRKVLPLPDGAILKINKKKNFKDFNFKKTFSADFRFIGLVLKNLPYFKLIWYPILKHYENYLVNNGPYPSFGSNISSNLIKKINFRDIIEVRRKNYVYLRDKLSSLDLDFLHQDLDKNVCPLSLPILVAERDKVREYLIMKKIYPPIHWDISSIINKSDFPLSINISNRILSLPIDQRYSINDMNKIAMEVSNALKN